MMRTTPVNKMGQRYQVNKNVLKFGTPKFQTKFRLLQSFLIRHFAVPLSILTDTCSCKKANFRPKTSLEKSVQILEHLLYLPISLISVSLKAAR